MNFQGLVLLSFFCWGAVPVMAADYLVIGGDSVATVAKKQNVPVAVLTRANPDVDWNHLKIGTKVSIPDSYTVKPKDTLYSLTKAWGVDQSALLVLNGLVPGTGLKVGQLLFIPPRSSEKASSSEVAGGSPGLWPVNRTPKSLADKLKSVSFATSGEPFRSVSSGTVLYVGEFRGVGRVLLVQNSDKVVFGYGNFEESAVAFGQTVSKGQVLGTTSSRPSQRLAFFCFKESVSLDPFQHKKVKNVQN